MPLKFVTVNDSVSAFGGLRAPRPPIGAPPGPWTPLGNFRPQIPSLVHF